MGRRRRLLIGLLSTLVGQGLLPPTADAQPSQPASTTSRSAELPADVLAALEGVEDFSFNFDHPAVYGLLEYLQNSPLSPGHTREPIEIEDWHVLLERPSDFRGEPVMVGGVVEHNRPWEYVGTAHPELGTVWQLELSRPDQPIACTVILTHDASDIPLGATIRVTGYFVMIRQYYSETNRVRQAALLVAQAPTLIARDVAGAPRSPRSGWVWLVIVVTAGLLAAWILLRRSTAGGPRDPRTLHAERSAPVSLADDLATWAAKDDTASADKAEQPNRTQPP
ncbi:MAG TPA: hypothetical protein VM487_21605 [Phycisphaerae bacterium]|nr:hypothetical protein [Phycisphaerae bacterium]